SCVEENPCRRIAMKDKLYTWADNRIYLIIMGLMVAIIAFFQPIVAFVMALVVGYMVYYTHKKIDEKNRELAKYIESLSHTFDSAAKHAIFNMPFPLSFIDDLGTVTWYNTPFLELMGGGDVLNRSI